MLISFVCMWKTEYVEGEMLTELEPFFADPKLAYPDYDFDDLVPAYVDNTGRVGGEKIYLGGPGSKLYAIPLGAETSVLAYRKDLFEQYNIKVPETYDEVRAAAKFFAEEVDGVYGLTMRGASGHHATHAWLLHADPFGAKVFDKNWEPAFTSQEAIDTLNFMKEMVKYGPPGIPGFTYDNQNNAFTEGLAAMYIDGIAISGRVNDPKISKVVGKVGYTLHPKAQDTIIIYWRVLVLGSRPMPQIRKRPFSLFNGSPQRTPIKKLSWLEGHHRECQRLLILNYRKEHPEYKVLAEQLPHADPDWRPITKEWGEINAQLLGVAINQALTGEKTPEEAMASIVEPVRAIMERGGYYK